MPKLPARCRAAVYRLCCHRNPPIRVCRSAFRAAGVPFVLSSQHHCNVFRSIWACSRVPLMLLSQRLYSNFWLRQLVFLVLLRLPFHDKTNMIYWKFQSPFLIYTVIITCKPDVMYRKCRSCPCARCKYGTGRHYTSPRFILRPAFVRCVYGPSRYYMIH